MVAFALGAGVGSGLGYRMGSSQVAVYTTDQNSPPRIETVDTETDELTILLNQRDEQSRHVLSTLEQKLDEITLRITALESSGTNSDISISPEAEQESAEDSQPIANQLQSQLIGEGFSQGEYDVIASTRDQLQLRRLQLRDKAIREGWFRSEEWVQQSRALDTDTELRQVLGDDRFDDYLTATGRNNRVKIDDVMNASAAQQAGLLPGDLIHRYADKRVYLSSELRNLTTAGESGEAIALTVLRNGELIDLSVPRGPLGVIISGVSASQGNQ